jgi:hypothetical protein
MYAQFDTGSLVGTVHDASGAVVPSALITVTNTATGIVATTSTNSAGDYEIPSLRVGDYRVTASAPGFEVAVANQIKLSVGTRQRIDLTLNIGHQKETVEVSGVALALETETSQRGQVVSLYQTKAFPLENLDVSSLVGLTTGVRVSSQGIQTQGNGLIRMGSFDVGGQPDMFNNYLLDGIDDNAYGESNQGFSNLVIQPPPDSMAQFQVVVNNESAEYGRSSGATINMAYNSGTNKFHFDAYDYLRNTVLNSTGFFLPTGGIKPPFVRNEFGGHLGGPIIKDRAFFYVDYDGFRQSRGLDAFSNLPIEEERNGIFPVPIKDPLTGVVYPANTQIPLGEFSPQALTITSYFPPTTDPTTKNSSNDYNQIQKFTDKMDKYDLRLDYQINPATASFARLSQSKELAVDYTPVPEPIDGGSNGRQYILDQQLALGITHQFGPNKLLDARLGIDYTKGNKTTLSVSQPLSTIPGLPITPGIAGGIPTQLVTGYVNIGRQYTNPQWQYPFVWDPKVNYSWVVGKHSLKFGYEYMHTAMAVMDVNPLYGLFYYQGAFSKPAAGTPGLPTGTPNDYYFADFLFGAPNREALSTEFVAQLRQFMDFAYAQDDWKVADKLVLNLGVRWEFGSPYYEKHNILTNFDPTTSPTTGQMLQAHNGSLYDRSLVNPDYGDWGPRIGFSYSATQNTVVHGGFGISYIHYNRAGSGNILPINAPQVLFVVQNEAPPFSANPTPGYRTLDQGFPAGLTSPANFHPLTDNITYVPRNYKDSYVESYFLSVQRQLKKNVVIDIGYVGNHGVKLLEFGNYNQANPALGVNPVTNKFLRPIPSFSDITYAFNGNYSKYNALQLRYEQRYENGLSLLNSFTWSRTFDGAAASLEDPNNNYSSPQNIYDLKADYGPSPYDQPLNDTTSVVYDLPFGKGHHFMNTGGLWNEVAGQWQISFINSMTSGQPVNVVYTPSSANQVSGIAADYRGSNEYRPNQNPGISVLAHAKGKPTLYLNSAAFTMPATTGPTGAPLSPFGNEERNPVRSDPYYDLDFAVNKNFVLPVNGMNLQFIAQFFNMLNKTNFQPPSSVLNTSNFGTITSTFDPRVLQFGLKLTY